MESNSAARSDSANQWIIDVLPNMVPILCYVMINSLLHASVTDYREYAKTSTATICMYHMSILYGYFLINDLKVRPAASAHARVWSESHYKNDFVNFLMRLPVPEFLVPILTQFQAFHTDRSKNVNFIPSAAGFDHDIFFGRVFPLSMFAVIHDTAANLPSNSSRTQVLNEVFSKVLYQIQAPAFQCVIPDLLGVTLDSTTTTTAYHMNSKLYQTFNSVFNPVLFRDYQRRTALAALSFEPPVYNTNHVNAYDLMFSATSGNLRELRVVLESVSNLFRNHVPCRSNLYDFITSTASPLVLKHGYSTFALPTWSHNEVTAKPSLFANATTFNLVSESTRAQDFSFLQRPATAIRHDHDVIDVEFIETSDPPKSAELPPKHAILRHFPFDLVVNKPAKDGFPRVDNDDLVKFNPEIHSTPSVLVLDTDGTLTVGAFLPGLAGKIIESFELDGATVEMPNADKSLGMQNCMFADSAISYRYVKPGSSFLPTNDAILPPLNRAPANSRPRLPASTLLHDRTKVMLPQFNTQVHEDRPFLTLPGLTKKAVVNVIRYAQSFIGFRTVDNVSKADKDDEVPEMDENQLLLWSPYSYTPVETDDYPAPNFSVSKHYFLTNLRTFFGTDVNLVQVKHPYEYLPAY